MPREDGMASEAERHAAAGCGHRHSPRAASQSCTTWATARLFLSIIIMWLLPMIPRSGSATTSTLPPAARSFA